MSGRPGLARSLAFVAGVLLVVAANALLLAGVRRNRGREEARLVLSDRELQLGHRWERDDDTSRSLRLVYEIDRATDEPSGLGSYAGMPDWVAAPDIPWLDRRKLAALGFDVRVDPAARRAREFYAHAEPRPVLLVLELDGPARQRALARAAAWAARDCPPSDPRCSAGAVEELARLRDPASRLFVVDAGLDAAALRRAHPDRARCAIAAGEVDLLLAPAEDGRPAHLRGWVRDLAIPQIHVPLPLRRAYDALSAEMERRSAPPPAPPDTQTPPFRATVAWGERLEPWLVDLAAVSPAPAPRPAR